MYISSYDGGVEKHMLLLMEGSLSSEAQLIWIVFGLVGSSCPKTDDYLLITSKVDLKFPQNRKRLRINKSL